uniref:Putative reverse transcriptase protein n=1 Tax=Axinella verrucosa TaxID=237119 RepID=A0A0U5J8D6_AXIVE|nr:putative reverse transcriptase protein [Axinella verrucosa]
MRRLIWAGKGRRSTMDCYDVHMSTGLGRRESRLLNIASLFEAEGRQNACANRPRDIVPMAMAEWLKAILLLPSLDGGYLGRHGVSEMRRLLWICSRRVTRLAGDTISVHNEDNSRPKGTRPNPGNSGWPKGRNPYGHRAGVVQGPASPGRPAVSASLTSRHYSTGSAPKVVRRLKGLTERCINHPNLAVDRNIYPLLCDPYLLTVAYNNIRSKPGNMTPGVVPETLDGVSYETVKEISDGLRNETFQFKPGRKTQIPKQSGGLRSLTIAPPRDKIVQEAMRILLNDIFEPTFSDLSHGFRPGRSCHTALQMIQQRFKPVTWMIEGDISKCFDSIDHGLLMAIIEKKIKDRQFTKLIWKSLRAGYFEFHTIRHNIAGTPQGSIISPILSNIFMHQLDVFVEEMKAEFDRGSRARNTAEYEHRRYLMKRAKRLGNTGELARIYKEAKKNPVMDFRDPSYKRLAYVRYADDWVVGVRGSYKEAERTLDRITEFCRSISLTVSQSKTKITNLNKDKADFLGVNIFRSKHVKHSRKSSSAKQRQNLQLQFHVSIDRVRSKLSSASIIRNGVAAPRFLWLPLSHRQIISLYNSVLRGYLNYYCFVGNHSRLVGWLRWTIYTSAAMLLGRKYGLSTTKVFKRFGPRLSDGDTAGLHDPDYKATGKFRSKANPIVTGLYAKHVSIANLERLACEICGSGYRVEMHHVRHMKDLNPAASVVDRLMARANRKQIPLCRECHMKRHRGEI